MELQDKILKSEAISEIVRLSSSIRKLRNLIEDIHARCNHSDAALSYQVGNFDVHICPDCGSKIPILRTNKDHTKHG